MNKLIVRLIGIFILVLSILLFKGNWLQPQIPTVLQDELSAQNQDVSPPTQENQTATHGELSTTPASEVSLQHDTQPAAATAAAKEQIQVDNTTATADVSSDEEHSVSTTLAPSAPQPSNPVKEIKSVDKAHGSAHDSSEQNVRHTSSVPVIPAQPILKITALEGRTDITQSARANHDNTAKSQPENATSTETIWLQAGSFSSRANANHHAVLIRKRGIAVDVEPVKVKKRTYYRVYIGPIHAKQRRAYLNKLKALGIKAQNVRR